MIRLQPGADGQGLSLSLSPSYGRVGSAGNSAERLWQQDAIHVDNDHNYSERIESSVGYGFPASGGGLWKTLRVCVFYWVPAVVGMTNIGFLHSL